MTAPKLTLIKGTRSEHLRELYRFDGRHLVMETAPDGPLAVWVLKQAR